MWILLLNRNGTVKDRWKITDGNFTRTLDDRDWFGEKLSPLGDLDGDGKLDLAVGADGDDEPMNSGAVWILFLTDMVVDAGAGAIAAGSVPRTSRLVANTPNPFDPTTSIHFNLAEPGPAKLQIFDVGGRVVRTFDLSDLPAGANAVTWDGRDERGRRVARQSHLVRLVEPDARDEMGVTMVK